MTPDDRSLLEAEHNEIVKWPKCGRRVMLKNEGRVDVYKRQALYNSVFEINNAAANLYSATEGGRP